MKIQQEEHINSYESLNRIGYLNVGLIFLRNVRIYRYLLYQLLKQIYYTRYKKSLLGVSWVVLTPIFGIISWLFLHYTGMLKPGKTDVPYPVYVLLGSSVAGLFLGMINKTGRSLVSERGLLLTLSIPRDIIAASRFVISFLDFYLVLLVNILIMLGFGVVPDWKILLFPIAILPLGMLGFAIGLIIALFRAISFEIEKVSGLLLGIVMWLTPVVYSSKIKIKGLKQINDWNPLTYLVCFPRDLILTGSTANWDKFLICSGVIVVIFIVVLRMFYRNERLLMEKLL